MRNLWNRLSLRLRLFVSFGILLAVMMVFSLSLQSHFYTKSRVENLLQHELPTQLNHLGAQVALSLAPSLQISRSLAGNTYLESWIRQGMPESQLKRVQAEMAQVHKQLDADMSLLLPMMVSAFFIITTRTVS